MTGIVATLACSCFGLALIIILGRLWAEQRARIEIHDRYAALRDDMDRRVAQNERAEQKRANARRSARLARR